MYSKSPASVSFCGSMLANNQSFLPLRHPSRRCRRVLRSLPGACAQHGSFVWFYQLVREWQSSDAVITKAQVAPGFTFAEYAAVRAGSITYALSLSYPVSPNDTTRPKNNLFRSDFAFFLPLWSLSLNGLGRRLKKPDATLWEHPCFFSEGYPHHLHKKSCDKKCMERRRDIFIFFRLAC